MAKSREQYIAENSEGNFEEDLYTFSLVDAATVARLQREGDVKLPAKKVDVPKDERWNTKQLNSKLLAGILNGDSIPKIANSLVEVIGNNAASAVRNARTMVTGAECAGRQDSYEELADNGVIQKKVWIATPDDRTRESHLEIDGEEVDVDEKFSNGLMYPADPSGDPSEVWNCRCTMRTHIVGFRKKDGSISAVNYERGKTMHDRQMEEEKEKHGIEDKPQEQKQARGEIHGDMAAHKNVIKTMQINSVPQKEVSDLQGTLTEEQIIAKLAGGDMTKGSCASLALSYCGNKVGFDVTDFRGGVSCAVFSRSFTIDDTIRAAGVNFEVIKVQREAKDIAKIIKGLEVNKEFLLSCGKHAAIIKNTAEGMMYLEMQSATHSGWRMMEGIVHTRYGDVRKTVEGTLADRFGCRKTVDSVKIGGEKHVFEKSVVLVPVDAFQSTDEFKDILGYINTATDKQKKGALGSEK